MLLKKQTVWLLTMLSLVVVLSVYYVTSDPKTNNDLAMVDKNGKNTSDKANSTTSKKDGKVNISTQVAGDQAFEAMRISRDDERSKLQEQLTNKLATTNLSADDKNKIYDEMQKLKDTAQQEQALETLIKSHGYKDALVESDGTNINITVKSKEQSTAAANDIIKLVEQQIGSSPQVAVEFQK
ncbi:stage III sporulation protein AH [Heyndrickxia shackletonii]|uniref:Stage III sporulation protein AH n=1 Tax=Heyndrickxia shackletonii TaxID=157838 RepID=A0A0Q3WXM8_9BACI|nr:SpoIIIAH-like family protein [Heyndrickxia shackletonii]KQL53581.1 stage III sporulation protein AH [Heyndrickxia shackletonii]NEY99669.1 SpoIIIAH-like family protein [Heyndrickxia shackletonii]